MANQYTIRWFILPQSGDLLKLAEPRQKLANRGDIIKAKRWWWKHEATDRPTASGRSCQTSTPSLQITHLLSLLASKARKFVTRLSRSLWASLISSDVYTLIHLCPSSGPGSANQIDSSLCLLFPFLVHLCPPPSCMPVGDALPVRVYETNCCHPSPFRDIV